MAHDSPTPAAGDLVASPAVNSTTLVTPPAHVALNLDWLLPMSVPVRLEALSDESRETLARAFPENTKRAYLCALNDFRRWAGMEHPLPASPAMVTNYLNHRRNHRKLAPSTLRTYAAAIRFAHLALGHPDPTADIVVSTTLRGIRRIAQTDHGWWPSRAPGTTVAAITAMTQINLDENLLREACDRAFLLTGFYGGFRQSELCAIKVADLKRDKKGLMVRMGATKTDQLNEKQHYKALPLYTKDKALCPVLAISEWLDLANISSDHVFRAVNDDGKLRRIRKKARHPGRMTATYANDILRRRATLAGLEETGYTVHSLRAGFVTASRRAGVPDWQIQRQTGHKDARMLNLYDRPESAFSDNAVVTLMDHMEELAKE